MRTALLSCLATSRTRVSHPTRGRATQSGDEQLGLRGLRLSHDTFLPSLPYSPWYTSLALHISASSSTEKQQLAHRVPARQIASSAAPRSRQHGSPVCPCVSSGRVRASSRPCQSDDREQQAS